MATNQVYDYGNSISLPVPDGTLSGQPVVVGALCGTARTTEGQGGNADNFATVDLVGPYQFTVIGALKPGQAVYIAGTPDANGLLTATTLTATVGSNILWGYSLTTKSSGSGLATVRPARI